MRPIIDTSKYPNSHLNISYGDISETLKLDIFSPENQKGPFPVIVSIHGGAFKAGDKLNGEMIEAMLHGLPRGYAVVGVNYRLSKEAKFPEPVKDIKRAIRFIKANASKYDLDPEKIVVWGGSAGAYMSLMSGVFESETLFDDEEDPNKDLSAKVQGVVAWFPPTDFTKMDEQLKESGLLHRCPDHDAENSPESLFLGVPIQENEDLVQRANPATYLNKNVSPMFIQHGRTDKIVPYQQSLEFVKKAKQLLGDDHVYYEVIEEADHGDAKFETEENLEKVYEFINKIFK